MGSCWTIGISSSYSTGASTNPLRYSSIHPLNEVHDIGEVGANMLHNVYASLIGEANFKMNADNEAGNVVFMLFFIYALAPTLPFIDFRSC